MPCMHAKYRAGTRLLTFRTMDRDGSQGNAVYEKDRILQTKDQVQQFPAILQGLIKGLESKAKTAVCAAVDGAVVAVYGISDALRPEASEVCLSPLALQPAND
jgi:cation transport ATPase